MIRFIILLALALLLVAAELLFPELMQQNLQLDAFGWRFESRQGALLLVLMVALVLLIVLRRLFIALLAGPRHFWQVLKGRTLRMREKRLRKAIGQVLDMRFDSSGAKELKKAGGLLPGWFSELLAIAMTPAREQSLPAEDADPLHIAAAARIATDPNAEPRPDLALRKQFVTRWLSASPHAPLALSRAVDIAEESDDWALATTLLETAWKGGHLSAASSKPRLARAYIKLASQQPEKAMEHLRKASRLTPDNSGVITATGEVYLRLGDRASARQIWMRHLARHNETTLAQRLLVEGCDDWLKNYRQLEKELQGQSKNEATLWLLAQLARKAQLEGLANDHLRILLDRFPGPLAFRTQGEWFVERSDWKQASEAFQKALANEDAVASTALRVC